MITGISTSNPHPSSPQPESVPASGRSRAVLLLAPLLLWLAACQDGRNPIDYSVNSLKKIGGKKHPFLLVLGTRQIQPGTFLQYRNRLAGTLDGTATFGNAENTAILSQFVESRLLLAAAEDEKVTVAPADRQRFQQILHRGEGEEGEIPEEEILIQKYLRIKLAGAIELSANAAEEYFARHPGEFNSPQRFHVREILVAEEKTAAHILEELLAGGKSRFGEYARQFSAAPTASSDGDMGFFQRGELPPEFEKHILSLKPGGFSPVIRTQYGFHIFYLEEVIQSHQQKLHEVREKITEQLRMEKERAAEAKLLEELYRRYRPVVYRENLDFVPDEQVLFKNIALEGNHAD